MTKFKPGELWAKHQEKMKKKLEKKHEKHKKMSPALNASMNAGALRQFGDKNVPNPIKGAQGNSNSTKMGTNPKYFKKHAKHRKHKKMCKTHGVEHTKAHEKKHEKHIKKLPSLTTKHSGKFESKSNALGHGGRAAQLKARGVPGGVIGDMARAAHAAPGQENYHGKHKKHEKKEHKHEKHHKMGKHCKTCSCE